MRGRLPQPTALKILRGNPGHRKIDASEEPQPEFGLGAPPVHLDPEAKRFWIEQGPALEKMRTLGKVDSGLFAMLCQAHSQNVHLTQEISRLQRRKRLTPREERRLSRWEAQRVKIWATYHKLGAELGIGAASRTRIRVKPDDGQTELPLSSEESPLTQALRLSRS